MPRVVLTRRAQRERLEAPGHIGQDLDEAIDRLGIVAGAPLRGTLVKLFRIRVDDWRILYEYRSDGTVRILRIAQRAVAYRNDPR